MGRIRAVPSWTGGLFPAEMIRRVGAFAFIPLGCSQIPQAMDGGDHFFAWQVIAGDFEAFKQARRDKLGDGALMHAEAISLEL